MKQELDVYLHHVYVGRLTRTDAGTISFAYDPNYVEQGLPALSVSMPLREKPYRGRVVKSFFFTPLPDFVVWKRRTYDRLLWRLLWECVPGSFASARKAKYFYLSDRERFAFLSDNGISAGAVDLCPRGSSLSASNVSEGENQILNGMLIREIIANPKVSIASMGGSTSKIPVYVERESGALVWVKGKKALSSTHILKNLGEHKAVINEFFCMRLGQSVGLSVSAVEMRVIDDIPCFLVARYDRTRPDGGQVEVLHQETFNQALGVLPGVTSERRGGPAIKHCLDLLERHSAKPEHDQVEFLTQIVFCYLIGRNDFNGRNLSLVYRNGLPELAPAHDLMGFFYSHDKLDMPIGGIRHPEKVRVKDWRRAVGETKFPILHEQLVRLPGECLEKSRELLRKFESEGILSDEFTTICSGIAQRARLVEQQLSRGSKGIRGGVSQGGTAGSMPVSVVVISANSSETIQRCLKSLSIFDEVIVYLNRCTDNTAELCAQFGNVRVIYGQFIGFGPTRNAAAKHARHPWILAIDTDEWLDDELKHSIQNAEWGASNRAYAMRRHQIIFGKSVTVRGTRAQKLVRLYHRETGRYTSQPVHESVKLQSGVKIKLLSGKLWHEKESRDKLNFGLNTLDHGVAYVDRFPKKKAIHPGWALLRAWATFFKKYILQRKCLAGWRGILQAHHIAHRVFVKHTAHYVNTRVLRDRQPED